ncbi:MAG: CRISPR system precrRNA processing endoribonuclease RAMP protein Cas6 [Anaerolineae bacterium]
MQNFSAHRLRFVAQVQTSIELNEHQGSAIRGALFHALRNRFCGLSRSRGRPNREAAECAACPLVATCPVATLVSTLKPGSVRGQDVPRPYTVQPPLPDTGGHPIETGNGPLVFRYEPGERLEFGLTLYAQALQLFPYVVLAVGEFERGGIGRKLQRAAGRWRRGTLTIQEVWAENPLTEERQAVMQADEQMVQVPNVPITHAQVRNLQIPNPKSQIRVHFLTPARIIERGRLVKPEHFRFQPFFQRLMERLEALSRDFSATPLRFDDPKGLIQAAGRVRVADNRLAWTELHSYSTRQQRSTPTSGLLGTVVLEADAAGGWSPFWPWLVWGQFVHVGKDAVKGNGWYVLEV